MRAPSPAPNIPPTAPSGESTAQRPMDIALAGLVALAVAMGIGRFAFTPLLPMMLHDGLLDLPGASWLASANYFGYLVGAVLCTLQPWLWARLRVLPLFAFVTLVRGGLVATGLLTLAMAWPAPAAWPVLRFAAGVTSAVVFVYTSGWCMARLARLGVPALSGMIYMGPGAGIVLSGLAASAMTAWHWRAAAGWVLFGLLAWVLAASVWRTLRGGDERLHAGASAAGQTGSGASAPPQGRAEMAWLALAYGLAGFGYIITIAQLPQKMIALFSNFITNRYTALLLINLFLLVVGMLMESLSALTLLTPILVPIAMSYGIDPIHFGIVMILNLMIGMLTPPVGMVLFVLSRMTPTPFEKICKAMVPFLGMCIIALIIIALVPPLVTFLPGVLM